MTEQEKRAQFFAKTGRIATSERIEYQAFLWGFEYGIESLRQQLDHIKQVDFPRKVEAVANGWKTKLAAQREYSKEQFERLLRWVDDYCEVSDADFEQIEPVVRSVLGEVFEETPLADLRQQLASLKNEIKSIGEAIDDPRTDLTMTMSEIIRELKQQLATSQAHNVMLRDALRDLTQCAPAEVECNNMHHKKQDQHSYDETCHVVVRYATALYDAQKALAATEPAP